jgi:hypothetical protein
MPKIFEYFGFVFYFYSNEHEPIHVHVIHNQQETIFELILQNGDLVQIKHRSRAGYQMLSSKDAKTAEMFIRKYAKNIVEKWVKFFVYKQQIRSTNIKNKL